jgi:hypothetical protein
MNLVFLSAGVEFSWKALIDTIRILPKISMQDLPKYGRLAKRDFETDGIKGRFGAGFLINVKEFPWFERIFVQGMNPVAAFSDINQYLASNN